MTFGLQSLSSVPITTTMNNPKSLGNPLGNTPVTVGSIWVAIFDRQTTIAIIVSSNGANCQLEVPEATLSMNTDALRRDKTPLNPHRDAHKKLLDRVIQSKETSEAWKRLYFTNVAKNECGAYVRICKMDLAEVGVDL